MGPGRGSARGLRFVVPLATAFVCYLGLAVAFFWGAWAHHPTATTTCACGDASLYFWFLEWPAHAILDGGSLFYSTFAFHPVGFNLVANTGVVALGVALAPVTWAFGPVASLNVASTLAPCLSALAMFWLLRRWVGWAPAAFVGGLLYGFSPFILNGLVAGWLTMFLPIPPLMVACLDELCVRQRHRPVPTGIALGLLCALQFLVSSELLVVTGLVAVLGLVALVLHSALFDRDALMARMRGALTGLAAGAVVAGALLAYPVWFALAGPAHFSGLVWPSLAPGAYGTDLSAFFRLSSTTASTLAQRRFGGYQGVALHQGVYLGYVLPVVLVVGLVAWRRDRRLWLFAWVTVSSMALCLSSVAGGGHLWVPWRSLAYVPIVQNILPLRFAAMVFLGAAVMLAVIVDHARAGLRAGGRRAGPHARHGAHARRQHAERRLRELAADLVAASVAVVALGPIAASYAGNLPLTMVPVVVPEWFAAVAPHLPPGQVVLTYPAAFGGIQAPMAWQAEDRMSFSLVGGGGPGSVPQRAGRERPGFTVLSDATVSVDPVTGYLPSTVSSVRQAITGWGTTLVVIPDQPGLPAYDQGDQTGYALAMTTAALGEAPRFEASAWVFSVGRRPAGPLLVAPGALRSCVGGANFPSGPPLRIPDCVLGAATRAAVGPAGTG